MSHDIIVDIYEPNYQDRCTVCGQSPCVTGVAGGITVLHLHLCGPCCFGSVKALDPVWWNGEEGV